MTSFPYPTEQERPDTYRSFIDYLNGGPIRVDVRDRIFIEAYCCWRTITVLLS